MNVDHHNDGVLRVNDDAVRRLSQVHDNIGKELSDAKDASSAEKGMSVRDSVRLYKKAICFSLIMSLAVIMEGYDLSLMGSFMGYDTFRARYGTETDADGAPIISAAWQTGLQNGVQVGSIIGLYLNGVSLFLSRTHTVRTRSQDPPPSSLYRHLFTNFISGFQRLSDIKEQCLSPWC